MVVKMAWLPWIVMTGIASIFDRSIPVFEVFSIQFVFVILFVFYLSVVCSCNIPVALLQKKKVRPTESIE